MSPMKIAVACGKHGLWWMGTGSEAAQFVPTSAASTVNGDAWASWASLPCTNGLLQSVASDRTRVSRAPWVRPTSRAWMRSMR